MGNELDHNASIRLLEHKVASIENNMAKQSDISAINEKIGDITTLASDIRGLTKEVHDFVSEFKAYKQDALHKERKDAKQDEDIENLKTSVNEIKLYIAADKPFKDMRSVAIKSLIGFLVLGILAASFYTTKS